jgi:hypothetical protein
VLSELDSGQTDVVYYNNENEIGKVKVPNTTERTKETRVRRFLPCLLST